LIKNLGLELRGKSKPEVVLVDVVGKVHEKLKPCNVCIPFMCFMYVHRANI
jgi:hypothetical protein